MVEFNGDNIIIMCCSSCNVKCKHCYIEYKGDISSNELEEMVLKLKSKYNITLNGSELLLNPGYLKVLNIIGQDRVTTNGLIIHNNDKLLDQMQLNGIKWVGMSFHFAFHDGISLIPKKIITDNITKLKERGFYVEIMTTISSINYQNIEEMVQESIKMNADCIRFTNLFKEGGANNIDHKLILNDDEINEFFDLFYYVKEKYGSMISVKRSGTFSRDLRKEKSCYYCPGMEKTVAISPDYKVYTCPFLIKDSYEIGKYEDGKVFLDYLYENDNTTCMLHNTLNRGKTYTKRRIVR